MSFDLYLKSKIENSNLVRSEIIAKLNLYHEEFFNLDAITLSRWINKKTTPSMYKQLLIAKFFHDDILTFLSTEAVFKDSPKYILDLYEKIINNIEKSYNNVNYFASCQNDPEYLILNINRKEYFEYLKSFYDNYRLYREMHYELKADIKKIYIYININGYPLSHMLISYMNEEFKCFLTNTFSTNISNKLRHIVNLSYITDYDSYTFMKSLIYFFFIKKDISNFLCIIREEFYELLLNLNFKQIGKTYIDDKTKIYLLEGDLLKILSNPINSNELLYHLDKSNVKEIINSIDCND
ncbi:hypothetical protein [Photobacterium damselae]